MSLESVGIIVALVAQTLMLGIWAGSLHRMVKQHDREINHEPGGLRWSRHEQATKLASHEARLTNLEEKHG